MSLIILIILIIPVYSRFILDIADTKYVQEKTNGECLAWPAERKFEIHFDQQRLTSELPSTQLTRDS